MAEHIIAGLVGGFAGTAAMSALMMPLMGDNPSLTQLMVSKMNKKPPEENQMVGMLLHFLYGTVMGLLFVVLFMDLMDQPLWELSDGVLWGLAWGLILWVGSFFWMAVLGMMKRMEDAPKQEKMKMMGGMLVAHALYGAVLGAIAAWMINAPGAAPV